MMQKLTRFAIAFVLFAPTAVSGLAAGESAPDLGRPFEPTPVSQPSYAIQNPTDSNGQRHIVRAADGIELFVETWLPTSQGGNTPPQELPSVVVMTPYAVKGVRMYELPDRVGPINHLVPRGYAVSVMHARGTGVSGGCFDDLSALDVEDGVRVVEFLATEAPWSNGVVGAFGLSQDGGRPFATAALGDPSRTDHLKAMVLLAPHVSRYGTSAFDGVPETLEAAYNYPNHVYDESFINGRGAHAAERPGCAPENMVPRIEHSGDVTPYYRSRDVRHGVGNVRAATLMVHGHRDLDEEPVIQAGLFDRLPASTPKAGIFGVMDHDFPSWHRSGLRTEWERPDFMPMVTAWFDRYLKGLDSNVESWPVAQVQGTDGQWRAEPEWPTTGGPVGHLALGAAGALATPAPAGSSSYVEGLPFHEESPIQNPPGDRVIWQTPPLPERLEITGQPILDMWVRLDKPDAHLAAKLEVFDATGESVIAGSVLGFRSMRHLEPLVEGRFWQARGRPAPVGIPVRVPLRFHPTDLVVPKGGWLRLTLAGYQTTGGGIESLVIDSPVHVFGQPSWPSFSFTTVEVLHDCEHVSALRFLMPRESPDLLNVREEDEPAEQPLADNRPFVAPVSDAGGLATAPVCGQAPVRLENFGPEMAYEPPAGS